VRSENPAPLEEVTDQGRRFDLSRVRPKRMDAEIERLGGAADRLDGERARSVCRAHHRPGLEKRLHPQGGRGLGPVDQGEPFLGGEREGMETGLPVVLDGRRRAPLPADRPLSHHPESEMRERDQIPARPEGAAARHDRKKIVLEHLDQVLEKARAHAARSKRERMRPERKHEPDRGGLELRPRSRRVTSEKVRLQTLDVALGNPHRLERAESGVDPVDRLPTAERLLDQIAGRLGATGCLGRERRSCSACKGAELAEREPGASERDLGGRYAGHGELSPASHSRAATAMAEADRSGSGRVGRVARKREP